ncbi:MAG: dTDP-4-dehydrorhamnose reductase [Puniceicoccales bacterium]|jgi:dTDP-4-dehydrorhamnose reductase|nr:dTDP-4-dehydrorhamnose reductase [Puniceicoccales bacterium]
MLLITGKNGQLGREVAALLPGAIATGSDELDITDEHAVTSFVAKHGIDTIVNCAAYTAVDRAENEHKLAESANVQGPLNLARTGAKIIHISTDYVFNGTNFKPYVETDNPNPCSVYGATKLAGEHAVLSNAETAIIIRTSWLYSPHRHNFLKTMLRLGPENTSLNVVFDQIGTPTYASDLAGAIFSILPKMEHGQRDIYHFSNEGACSWYDFAVEIMRLARLKCEINPIESRDYSTKARRPFYSVLNKSKIKNDFKVKIPHWKESLQKCMSRF